MYYTSTKLFKKCIRYNDVILHSSLITMMQHDHTRSRSSSNDVTFDKPIGIVVFYSSFGD